MQVYDNIAADQNVSISAIGEALIALEREIEELNVEAERLHTKLKYITTKQLLCTASIKKILTEANKGSYPAPCARREFPELSRKG